MVDHPEPSIRSLISLDMEMGVEEHLSDWTEPSSLSAKSSNHVWRKDSCIAVALGSSRRGPLPGAPRRGFTLTLQNATTSVTLCWQDPCSGGRPMHITTRLHITTQEENECAQSSGLQ